LLGNFLAVVLFAGADVRFEVFLGEARFVAAADPDFLVVRFLVAEVFLFAVPLRVAADPAFAAVRFRVADVFLAAGLLRGAADADLVFGRALLRFLAAFTAAPETAPRTAPTTGRPTTLPATAPATAPPRVLPAVLFTASASFSSLSWSSMPLCLSLLWKDVAPSELARLISGSGVERLPAASVIAKTRFASSPSNLA
jgi:hypothetical protein